MGTGSGETMRQARVRSTGSGAAALLVALAWLVVPLEACIAAAAAGETAVSQPACAACEEPVDAAAMFVQPECAVTATCFAERMEPCRQGEALPPEGMGGVAVAVPRAFRLPATDPHGAPVPPGSPPSHIKPQYLLCCSFLI